jgi:hypothetical protein
MPDTSTNKRKTTSIGLIVLTFLAIALETVLFLPAILRAQQVFLIQHQAELLLPTDWLSFLGFVILPIIYCSFASIALHPKTMVNPIHIQIGTSALVIILTLINLSTGSPTITAQLVGILSLSVVFSSVIVITIGIVQLMAVSWVIRMNYEDSDRISYIIKLKPKEMLHKLGNSFLDDWTFSRERDVSEFWVLERNDNDRCLLLEVGANPKDDTQTILATVAYEIIGNFIVKSDSANRIRDAILCDIEKRIGINFRDKTTDLDDPVSKLAFVNVENYAHSRIEMTWSFLRKLSRLFKVMLGLTLMLFLGLVVVYYNFNEPKIISSDTFVGALVVLMIALFVEIGIPLREELQKTKREEIEF